MKSRLLISALLLVSMAACKDGPIDPSAPRPEFREGEVHQFNVNSTDTCTNPDYRSGRVVAVTQRAIVVADVNNPQGGFTDEEYRELGTTFDEFVWPMAAQNFGEPADVDRNNRVIIFYTRAVNELTPRGQNWYVGGFFFSRDLFPKTNTAGFQGCAASNHSEMFYMLVPDPTGAVNNNPRSKDLVRSTTVGVLGHEFQHLINASRRLYVNRATGTNWNEEVWLNEGLSHIAEELLAYSASDLAPRQNIDANRIAGSAETQRAFSLYMIGNISRFANYIQEPDTASLIGPDNLATRGATWHFLRYAADRRGGSETALWRSMVNTTSSGLANLQASFGSEPVSWIQDWLVAIYTDDAVPGVNPRFTQSSWNLRAIYPRLQNAAGQLTYGRYPLKVRSLVNGVDLPLSIPAAGAAYLRFGVPAGGQGEIRTAPDGACGGPRQLTVGEVITVTGAEARAVCLAGGVTGAEFTYIPFFASTVAAERLPLTVRGSGIIGVAGPPNPSLIPGADAGTQAAIQMVDEGPVPNRAWELNLRAREIRDLTPLVAGATPPLRDGALAVSPLSSIAAANDARLRVSIVRTR